MPDLSSIRERLGLHEAVCADPADAEMVAAVALILHEPADGPPELLFIERAHREGDPWSGQMAFPGGRQETDDPDLQGTAIRETFEEIGVRLGEPIGRLDDLSGSRGGNRRILVAPFVYALGQRPDLRPNHEVNSAVWVPLRWILNPDSAVEYRLELKGFRGRYPAFSYAGYTVWGLTYRITGNFMQVIGRGLPPNQEAQEEWDKQSR
jgi:8-oxo-dGTP pyrophosphatase MutT (NUDIX family)